MSSSSTMVQFGKQSIFRVIGAIFAVCLVVGSLVYSVQPAQAAGSCTAPPSNPIFSPASTSVDKGQSITFSAKVIVTCSSSTPASGYTLKLFLIEGSTLTEYSNAIAFPGYTDKGNGQYEFNVTGDFVPLNDTDTSRNFKVTAYPPNGSTGYSSSVVTITLKNSNQNDSCTNTNDSKCGQLNVGDFDKTVANLINPINIESFPELVVFVMKGFIFLIGIMSVLVIIIGGVRMVLSAGNQESVTKGKQTVIWAVAGLVVSLLSFSLVSIIQNLLSKGK